jgi:hypothetical protein
MNIKYILIVLVCSGCFSINRTIKLDNRLDIYYNHFNASDFPILMDPYNSIGSSPHKLGLKILSDSFLIWYTLWKGKRYKEMYGGDIGIDSLKYYSIKDTLFIGYAQKYLVRNDNDSIYLLLNLNKSYSMRDSFYFIKNNSVVDKQLIMGVLWFWLED